MDNKPDFRPECALIVYSSNNEYYIEENELLLNKETQQYVFGAAKPLSMKKAKTIFSGISEKSTNSFKSSGIMPTNVISVDFSSDSYKLYWVVESHENTMKIDFNKFKLDSVVTYPKLLFKLSKNSGLNVYALKNEEITNDTMVYMSPFPNVSSNGSVCMGNVKINRNKSEISEIMKDVQQKFFGSVFTHLNNNKVATVDVYSYWKKASKNRFPFKEEILIESGKTIKEIIDG